MNRALIFPEVSLCIYKRFEFSAIIPEHVRAVLLLQSRKTHIMVMRSLNVEAGRWLRLLVKGKHRARLHEVFSRIFGSQN